MLRVRSTALALALLPAAAAVILWVGRSTGQFGLGPSPGWDAARWTVTALAVLALGCAAVAGLVIARGRPAVSPTVPLDERAAPDLHALVRDLAERLEVPAPSAIALTPDCDSWLEDRTHDGPPAGTHSAEGDGRDGAPGAHKGPHEGASGATREGARGGTHESANGGAHPGAHGDARHGPNAAGAVRGAARSGSGAYGGSGRGAGTAPVLVIGSPFLWWMRVAELRALLAPVVAGTGPSAHPDIAAARRFVRGLDAAVAGSEHAPLPGHPGQWGNGPAGEGGPGPPGRSAGVPVPAVLRRTVHRLVARLARRLLRSVGPHAAEMERGVAAAAAERAHAVDYGLRVAAQEQVGLAYAGWDRLLTRVALPAWRLGLWPTRLDAGVVSALTELSHRDRLAEGFTSRLGERPACDLLVEPGSVDGAVSLLAARLFLGPHPPLPPDGEPTGSGSGAGSCRGGAGSAGAAHEGPSVPEWTPVEWSAYPEEVVDRIWRAEASRLFDALEALDPAAPAEDGRTQGAPPPYAPVAQPAGTASPGQRPVTVSPAAVAPRGPGGPEHESGEGPASAQLAVPTLARVLDRFTAPGGTDALAARLTAQVARAEAARAPGSVGASPGAQLTAGAVDPRPAPPVPPAPMGLPLQSPRSGRELLADHVTAAVCCAAVDTAGATPGLDWLDGPALFVDGERAGELAGLVLALVEDGEAEGLRDWLVRVGVRPEKPVRLV
ncbi:hypothetical protein [Streptomyces reniochalinae]|uniref:Uncharacterized protein n=1 Tax=Streptomyces reniochalinae TaxID=2250578 RepID=A0A367F1H7_9ACTN|nr:hypothetical protein DQ392_03020 [Streptomyces reniochalinae]